MVHIVLPYCCQYTSLITGCCPAVYCFFVIKISLKRFSKDFIKLLCYTYSHYFVLRGYKWSSSAVAEASICFLCLQNPEVLCSFPTQILVFFMSLLRGLLSHSVQYLYYKASILPVQSGDCDKGLLFVWPSCLLLHFQRKVITKIKQDPADVSDSNHVNICFLVFSEKRLMWNKLNTEDSVVHRWPDLKKTGFLYWKGNGIHFIKIAEWCLSKFIMKLNAQPHFLFVEQMQ